MSQQTQTNAAEEQLLKTWEGSFSLVNSTSMDITWVSVEHCCEDSPTVTISEAQMSPGETSAKSDFETTRLKRDYWFVSFIDSSNNLNSGSLVLDYHEENGEVVIILQDKGFTISIDGNNADMEPYFQKEV